MPDSKNLSYAIRTLMITGFIVLITNMACARGAGVKILAFLGQVQHDDIDLRENIMMGVDFMQMAIKVTAIIGIGVFTYFISRSFRKTNNS